MNRKCSFPSWCTVSLFRKYTNKNFGEKVRELLTHSHGLSVALVTAVLNQCTEHEHVRTQLSYILYKMCGPSVRYDMRRSVSPQLQDCVQLLLPGCRLDLDI